MNPREMREKLVASYLGSYRKAGIEATTAEIERLVVADLHLVDRARAAGELSGGSKSSAPKNKPKRPDVLDDAAQAANKRVVREASGRLRPEALYRNPMQVSARWGAAVARIARITEGVARSSSLEAALAGAEYPALAREFAETWSFYMTRARPAPVGVDRNPFRGLSDADASRAFMRRVEDICDRSTGVLGSWYTR